MMFVEPLLMLVSIQVAEEKKRLVALVDTTEDFDQLSGAVLSYHRLKYLDGIIDDALHCVGTMNGVVDWKDVAK